MTLSPKLGVVEISTLWHFRLPLPIQMFLKVASSPRLSGIGMPSPILWSHPLKMQRIVLLSSLLWWELGTNSLITGPGEWLSFRRFTSKLSWSWTSPLASVMAQNSCSVRVKVFKLINGSSRETNKSQISTMTKQRWGLDRNVLRPTAGGRYYPQNLETLYLTGNKQWTFKISIPLKFRLLQDKKGILLNYTSIENNQ